ncbi:MAG: ATP-binding protein [Nannocystaceae bacterium]
MSEPAELRVTDALDKLIHQFSDPLSFYREVIQNALDAGSQEVEIRITFEPSGGGDKGLMTVHVDDWGEGMTREIIEKRLTRLFSSSKDGDRTKIGKFGIGFVSIFATDPELVCIDTSREGEHWRILFKADKRFELRRLEVPVDGTKIRIFKPTTRGEYEAIERRSREVIKYWCKHTRGEVRYQGEVLTEPLGLQDAPIQVREESDASVLIVGHPSPPCSFFGLYNRGLTLLEGGAVHFSDLAFKISSDHLEHTLTRDNVIETEAYHRLLARLRALIDGDLARAVFARLGAAIEAGEAPDEYVYRAAAWHLSLGRPLPREAEDAPVAVAPSGRTIRLAELRRACAQASKGKEALLRAAARSPVTDALEVRGESLVVLAPEGAPALRLLAGLGLVDPPSVDLYCVTLPPRDEIETKRWQPLVRATEALLAAQGSKLAGVAIGHFHYPGSSIAGRVAITQRRFGDLDRVDEVRELGASIFSRRRLLVVNADHPTVAALVDLAQREPELAAYVLAKLFFLGHRLDADLDGELARLAVEQRGARRIS